MVQASKSLLVELVVACEAMPSLVERGEPVIVGGGCYLQVRYQPYTCIHVSLHNEDQMNHSRTDARHSLTPDTQSPTYAHHMHCVNNTSGGSGYGYLLRLHTH